jgi:hypothetical protein
MQTIYHGVEKMVATKNVRKLSREYLGLRRAKRYPRLGDDL